MQKFLVPVDFSDASAHVLRFVFEMNKHFFAQLEVIHLFNVPFAIDDESGETITTYEQYRESYENDVWDLINANKGDYHFDIDVKVTAGGHYQGILDYAKKTNADLVIIGNKGAGKPKRWNFGSVAKYLITHPEVPVLAIPESFSQDTLKNILFATDLISPLTDYHYNFVKNFAEKMNAELHIVNVKDESARPLESEKKQLMSIG